MALAAKRVEQVKLLELAMTTNNNITKILADYLSGTQSAVDISPELIDLAQSHQVLPILYFQTKDETLKPAYLQAISSYTQRKRLLEQITEAFADFPFYTVKGFSVSRYYPVPQLRTMGDCDIIVHERDKERARDILISIGFTDHTGEWDGAEWHFEKQGMEFELHHRLLYDEAVNTAQEQAFADTAWCYVKNHELDVNFHFVYLLLHLKKHLLMRGVGIRQFMDLALMSKNAGLDRQQVEELLHQAEIGKFAGVCSALCLRWFGIALPVETPEISDEFFAEATETILANGVFGFEVPYDEEKGMLNSIRKSGKFSVILGYLFPSYRSFCITPKYKWIRGKPYLLPILWIYRIFWALFSGKNKSSMEHIAAVATSNSAMEKRNAILTSWGL